MSCFIQKITYLRNKIFGESIMNKIIIMSMFFITFLPYLLISQNERRTGVSQSDIQDIQTIIENIYGSDYSVTNVINVNRAIGNKWVSNGKINDIYETLKDTYIYCASGIKSSNITPKGFIGITMNGQDYWHSDTLIFNNNITSGYVWQTRDLNNDDQIEIITIWSLNSSFPQYLWLFSWDGNVGKCINETDKNGQTVIWSADFEGFEFPDINGDGILEIKGWRDGEEDTDEIYSWNGQFYGKWADTPELNDGELLPRDNLDVKVKSSVKKKDEVYFYKYKIYNDEFSAQNINQILLECDINSVQKSYSRKNWDFNLWNNLLGWTCIRESISSFIVPGEADSSFGYISYGLPKIFNFYIRGYNGGQSSFQDYKENSFHSVTLGAAMPPDPFISTDFLDSLIYNIDQSKEIGWTSDSVIANKYISYFENVYMYVNQNQKLSGLETIDSVLTDVDIDSSASLASEAYALIKYNAEYLKEQLEQTIVPSNYNVILKDSQGSLLPGGSLQYYEGGWQYAINNGDGTFKVDTDKSTISLRMTYAFGSQTISNVSVNDSVVSFQTVATQVQLQNGSGSLMDEGMVQYYAGGWRELGITSGGIAVKELLPNNYSFRMSYAFASNDKQQDIGVDPTVVFQTVPAQVELRNSSNTLIDEGTVQYYSGGWRELGVTSGGVAVKELLPKNYSFRINYAYASNDKQQDIGTDPTVIFQTVPAQIQLRNSLGTLMDEGTVQYYSGGWRELGITSGGVVVKELLPKNYSFRMSYAFASNDKQQDIGVDPTVVFQTAPAQVELRNSSGSLMDEGTVQYYSGGWRELGVTSGGVAVKELLPKNYSFRMGYAFASNNKQQDISVDPMVVFSTILATVNVTDQDSQPVNAAETRYYSGGWRTIGTTVNGSTNIELLPKSYSFRAVFSGTSQDKQQDISTDQVVNIQLGL
jgi:hypothetical protein